nr:hypothetical protein [Heyndrickxia oleronia]
MGGTGIAIRCDHTNDTETESVINQIRKEQGKLDILINNVWGAHDLGVDAKPFWGAAVETLGYDVYCWCARPVSH